LDSALAKYRPSTHTRKARNTAIEKTLEVERGFDGEGAIRSEVAASRRLLWDMARSADSSL
jgi:hypothetical protein